MAFESINEVDVGDSNYTMMHASLANRVIRLCNAVGFMKCKPDGIADVNVSDTEITITFKTVTLIACLPDGTQKTFTLLGMETADQPEE